MGCGIAAAFLLAGFPVELTDKDGKTREALPERVARLLERAKPDRQVGQLRIADTIDEMSNCDLIVEAVFEDLSVKQAVMAELGRIAKPRAVLASNTSYLDLDALALATGRPEAVVGLHFFAPATVMKLLEVVQGERTSPGVLAAALSLGRRLGKVCVIAGVCEGFIGNRIYNAYRAECEAMLLEGATPQEVDTALQAFGFAMGPFAVSDLSGLDIAWANCRRKQQRTGQKSEMPVLEWLVTEGRLGRKSGAGWYRYDAEAEDGKPLPDEQVTELLRRASSEGGILRRSLAADVIRERALESIEAEAQKVLAEGIAKRASDIDLVMIYGYGYPKHTGGPLYRAARREAP